jgi:hypothetical protein
MRQETRIDVPSEDADWVREELAEAGLTVLDTGERVTTEEGQQAVLHVGRVSEDGQATMTSTRVRR